MRLIATVERTFSATATIHIVDLDECTIDDGVYHGHPYLIVKDVAAFGGVTSGGGDWLISITNEIVAEPTNQYRSEMDADLLAVRRQIDQALFYDDGSEKRRLTIEQAIKAVQEMGIEIVSNDDLLAAVRGKKEEAKS